jgi:methylenetetrahydrofolate dehydrogenase (NADP+) / methenyltetrahydrofolate cyclohydrolase
MPHQINGRSILKQIKSRIEIYRDRLKDNLSGMKIVIFQFDSPLGLTDSYEISKYKAADTSTAQKCKLFGDFLGCNVEIVKLSHNTQFKEFKRIISIHNSDKNVRGIIIQYPIPQKLHPADKKSQQIVQLIATSKDIDAMSNSGLEHWGRCATADAICRVVDTGLKPGCRITVIGSKGFVGRDIVKYLQDKGLEPETIDKDNQEDIKELNILKPSILVSATGQQEIITVEFLENTEIDIIIDCGFIITDEKDEKGNNIIIGDVAKDARELAQFVTPVPGGIGPMEMAVLLERFMIQEFPQLKLEPWKLIKLDKLTAELANRSPDDKTPIDYLVDPEVEFRESINATVIHRSKPPDTPGNGRALQ